MALESEDFQLAGDVLEVSFRGSVHRLGVKVKGIPLTFDLPADVALPGIGDKVRLVLREGAIQVFRNEYSF